MSSMLQKRAYIEKELASYVDNDAVKTTNLFLQERIQLSDWTHTRLAGRFELVIKMKFGDNCVDASLPLSNALLLIGLQA